MPINLTSSLYSFLLLSYTVPNAEYFFGYFIFIEFNLSYRRHIKRVGHNYLSWKIIDGTTKFILFDTNVADACCCAA